MNQNMSKMQSNKASNCSHQRIAKPNDHNQVPDLDNHSNCKPKITKPTLAENVSFIDIYSVTVIYGYSQGHHHHINNNDD